jgi:cytochrome c oxidase subunit 3
MQTYRPVPEDHYEDLPKQHHAGRLGLWVFLGSELLFFAALFALYAAYRTEHVAAFQAGVHHNAVVLGSVNTGILLVGSTLAAVGVALFRRDRADAGAALFAVTAALGVVFLAVKFTEYGMHFREGIYPGGAGRFFAEHPERGYPIFFTLYFAMTGLHALHVIGGIGFLSTIALWARRRRVGRAGAHRAELAALYWHFVDLIWIFLWPMFYLLGRHG